MDRGELELEVAICHQCALSGRHVLSRGNPNASIMIIGEAPGAEEEKQGLPFVGPSGLELNHKLKELSLTEEDVYITNCVLCRPPDNRTPSGDEVRACKYFLDAQIEMIKPKIIVVLGLVAFNTLTGRVGIIRHAGAIIPMSKFIVVVIPHPASILHNPDNRTIWDDAWKKLQVYLEKKKIEAAQPAPVAQEPKKQTYINLHHHSEHSVGDAYGGIEEIVARLKEMGVPAGAITDHGTCSGLFNFYKACRDAGIKPILGMEAYICKNHTEMKDRNIRHITLLAKNLKGYQNLLELSTIAYKEGFYYKPRIDFELLNKYHEGLICLSGCRNSALLIEATAGESFAAMVGNNVVMLKNMFGNDFYLELMPHLEENQIIWNGVLLTMAENLDVQCVVTNDCHYILADDVEAHQVVLFKSDKTYTGRLHILSQKDLEDSFTQWLPYPKDYTFQRLLDNITAINNKIEAYDIPRGKNILPIPKIDDELAVVDKNENEITDDRRFPVYLEYLAMEGFALRIVPNVSPDHILKYQKRLEYELKTVKDLNFVNYFLIIKEYLDWCKQEGIWFQARGSSGGSLIAYCLGITNVDPLKYDLVFERFISPNRTDLPDIDIDVIDYERERVINHLKETYGEENIARISAPIRMTGKLCMKEIGRYLEIPFQDVNRITDLIQKQSKGDTRVYNTIEDSWQNEGLSAFRNLYPQVLPLAKKLEGALKVKGTHAAGVVIAPKPIYNYIPVERASKHVVNDGEEVKWKEDDDDEKKEKPVVGLVTGYNMQEIEELGLLKLDILSSNMLSVLKMAEELVKESHGAINWEKIDLYDPPTFAQFTAGHTLGVHQFDGAGITQMTRSAGVKSFEDLCTLNALYRPGPLESGMVTEYIQIKNGYTSITKVHHIYDEICKPTLGLIVYQEQVLRILREIGGMDWDLVNKIRKAIAKSKGQEAVNQYRAPFIKGAIDTGLSSGTAEQIFDSIIKYGKYGFNKAHSALYSAVSFKCMYLKTHYPLQYLTALLCLTTKNRIYEYVAEARRLRIEVAPPNINASQVTFYPYKTKILIGLGNVHGVGATLAEEIIKKRPYADLKDFIIRTDNLTKETLLNLIKAGALDGLYTSRKAVYDQVENIWERLRSARKTTQMGALEKYAEIEDRIEFAIWENINEEWEPIVKFRHQLEAIGIPGGYTVLDENLYKRLPRKVIDNLETISRVIALQPQKVSVIGWLKIIAKLKNNVKVCALSDEFGRILEIVAFEKMKAIENLPDYTLVICNIKMNDYKGRSGYVLEKYDPIID